MEEDFERDDPDNINVAIRDAAERWVRAFGYIPRNVILKLHKAGDQIIEITPTDTDEHESFLPLWDTLWSFNSGVDECWLEDEGNLQAMADCGFRIYKQEDYGYIFGIDGVGYDFYETHWIPLYRARGLRWHL